MSVQKQAERVGMNKEKIEITSDGKRSVFPMLESVLEKCRDGRVSWIDAAKSCGIDPVCFRLLFNTWTGVDPERLIDVLTPGNLRKRLDSGSMDPDLFSPSLGGIRSRPDSKIEIVPISPETSANATFEVRYAGYRTLFGKVVLASTSVGICFAGFVDTDEISFPVELLHLFPRATFLFESDEMHRRALAYFNDGSRLSDPICLHLKGTPFQLDVWRHLLRIPRGGLTTYGALARQIGNPSASRAVGSAVGSNPVACLIPCHRVIRSSGALGGYRWGLARKLLMLGRELIGPPVR